MSFAVVFIFQGGEIEPKAALLAASLREFMCQEMELIAAVPVYDEVLPPTNEGLAFLKSLNIKIEEIENHVDPTYPIANKIAALAVPTIADHVIFLDSDTLCLRGFQYSERLFESDFSARLSDFREISHQQWEEIYKYLECEAPLFSYQSLITQDPMSLYF